MRESGKLSPCSMVVQIPSGDRSEKQCPLLEGGSGHSQPFIRYNTEGQNERGGHHEKELRNSEDRWQCSCSSLLNRSNPEGKEVRSCVDLASFFIVNVISSAPIELQACCFHYISKRGRYRCGLLLCFSLFFLQQGLLPPMQCQ